MRVMSARPTVAAMADAVELEAGGRKVRLSNPDKVYFPERGFTKLDVARYYLAVGDGITRALRDRPTTLERFPDGVEGESFFQKRAPKNLPDWIPTAHISFPSGRSADEIRPTEVAAVLWAANLGTLTFHPWPVRGDATDHPDELRIDLDPQPGTGFTDAVRAAHELRALLDEYGLRGWPKTSGGRGLHVYVPIAPRWTFAGVRRAAIAVGRELERRMPGRVTTAWWKEERADLRRLQPDRPGPDHRLRVLHPAQAPRARVRALALAGARRRGPRDFDLATMPVRYQDEGDVHADMEEHAFGLEGLLELAERDEREHGLGDLPYPPDHPKMPGEPTRVQPSRAKGSSGKRAEEDHPTDGGKRAEEDPGAREEARRSRPST